MNAECTARYATTPKSTRIPSRFRLKFFIFASDGTGGRTGSEEVTSHIDLTGPDSFEAAATFDLFDGAGNMTAQGCRINETATRFE